MMKMKVNKKIAGASAMLMLSATMLGTSTFAWFTMNKEVSVTGMQVKAHAEEGLLINEVAAFDSTTWDELATANVNPTTVIMRPSSTYDLVTWWHANSKRSYDEAGVEDLSGTVDVNTSGDKYLNVSPGADGVRDNEVVSSSQATGNQKAETHVYFKDASFGQNSGSCDDGEGFYVKYKYYLKSSGDADLSVSNLQVKVKATKNTTGANASGSSDDLDPCLRVGVTMDTTVAGGTVAGTKIFAPIPGDASGSGATNQTYDVTKNAKGDSTETVTTVVASAKGQYTLLTKLNDNNITIPNVNSNGIPVYVYVWFEGEDTHCMSDNLTTALAAYDIDITFYDADVY